MLLDGWGNAVPHEEFSGIPPRHAGRKRSLEEARERKVSLVFGLKKGKVDILHPQPRHPCLEGDKEVDCNESADRRKTGMTEIYIELGGKKAIAWSLEWPGWCRIRTSEAAAVQALIETEVRYRVIAQRAGLKFAPGDLMVVERLPGDANTAWGVPSVLAPAETRPIDVVTAQRNVSLLRRAAGCRGLERQLRGPAHGLACGRSPLGNRRSSKLIAVVRKGGQGNRPGPNLAETPCRASLSGEDAGGRMQRERVALSENCEEV